MKKSISPGLILAYVLVLFSCTVVLYFGISLGWKTYKYFSRNLEFPVKIIRWEIEELGSQYAVQAVYEYEYKEKKILCFYRFEATFLNEHAALDSMRELSRQTWKAYCPSNLPEKSVLENAFPKNLGMRFFISVFVLIYFFLFKKKLLSNFNV